MIWITTHLLPTGLVSIYGNGPTVLYYSELLDLSHVIFAILGKQRQKKVRPY